MPTDDPSAPLLEAVAEQNAALLNQARGMRLAAETIIASRDADALIECLQTALDALDTFVCDVTRTLAEGASAYRDDSRFRALVNRLTERGEGP